MRVIGTDVTGRGYSAICFCLAGYAPILLIAARAACLMRVEQ